MTYLRPTLSVLLAVFVVSGTVQANESATELFKNHREWFECETSDECISVGISGKLKTTGQTMCDQPVINKAYLDQYKELLSEKFDGWGIEPACPVNWGVPPPVVKCINNHCGRQICTAEHSCQFHTTLP